MCYKESMKFDKKGFLGNKFHSKSLFSYGGYFNFSILFALNYIDFWDKYSSILFHFISFSFK